MDDKNYCSLFDSYTSSSHDLANIPLSLRCYTTSDTQNCDNSCSANFILLGEARLYLPNGMGCVPFKGLCILVCFIAATVVWSLLLFKHIIHNLYAYIESQATWHYACLVLPQVAPVKGRSGVEE